MSRKSEAKIHQHHVDKRNIRLKNNIYGEVQAPSLPKDVIMYVEPPSYLAARATAKKNNAILNDGIDRRLDMRCFYSSMPCHPGPTHRPFQWNSDPKVLPLLGTRDHIVPARRHVPNCPIDINKYQTTTVWSANMVNVTLGLTPMPIRLKIRQWLMAAPFSRDDTSLEACANIRWLIIDMLSDFRINGRYPWSRNEHGKWWDPSISIPLMSKWWKMEIEFLTLSEIERNKWIDDFVYHY
jgi:hypothetical protein